MSLNPYNSLTKDQQQKIMTWVGKLNRKGIKIKGKKGYIKWVSEKHKEIAQVIEEYKPINTRKAHYSALAVVLRKLGEEKEYKKYSLISTELNKQHEKEAKEQKVAPHRLKNMITWSELKEKRAKYKKKFEENPKSNKINMQYLILALYSLQPPLRMDYMDMKIVTNKTDTKSDKKNFILNKDGEYTVIINFDKTSRKYGRGEIKIESKELIEIINNSLKEYPRNYILSLITNPKLPLGKQNFERINGEIWKPKKVSIDIYRSVYITRFYEKNPSLKEKEALAEKMRHSAEIAEREYRKINQKEVVSDSESSDSDSDNDSDSESSDSEDEKKPQRKYFNRKEYMKTYRERNKVKLKKKAKEYEATHRHERNRAKLLKELNVYKNVETPRDSTIKKYKLVYNPKKKIWV